MGYTLTLYALDWEAYLNAIQSAATATRAYEQEFSELWEFVEPDTAWQIGLAALRASSGQLLDLNARVVAAAFLRLEAIPLEELEHASRSGEAFRTNFLANVVGAAFALPALDELLLTRNISGICAYERPSIGGLRQEEIVAAVNQYQDPGRLEDVDQDGWLGQLERALQYALDYKRDIISLYY